jgi:hypothetical protein
MYAMTVSSTSPLECWTSGLSLSKTPRSVRVEVSRLVEGGGGGRDGVGNSSDGPLVSSGATAAGRPVFGAETGGVGRDLDVIRTARPADWEIEDGRFLLDVGGWLLLGRGSVVVARSKTLEEGEFAAVSRRVAKTCRGEPFRLGEAYGRYVLGAGEVERARAIGVEEAEGVRKGRISAVGVIGE